MASIQERPRAGGKTAYRVMFRIDSKLVGETFETPQGAGAFVDLIDKYGGLAAREILQARQGNTKATPTVAQMCVSHVEHLSGITTGTRRDYLDIIRRCIEASPIGALPVDALTKKHVAGWVRSQADKGLSGKTIRNRHSLLSAAMTTAIDEELIGANPCRGTKIPQTERRAMTFLTRGEYGILEHHMPQRWKPLTTTLVGTGLRFSEATALQVRDLHLDDDVPNLRVERSWKWTDGGPAELGPPKTRKGRRTVSLDANVVDALRPLIKGRDFADYVFTTAGGKPVRNVDYREDGWNRGLRAAMATKGKDGKKVPADRRLSKRPRIHDLRHTHASWLIAQGVPLAVIQYRLGHESIKTTVDVYGHLADDALALAARATSTAFGDYRIDWETYAIEAGQGDVIEAEFVEDEEDDEE